MPQDGLHPICPNCQNLAKIFSPRTTSQQHFTSKLSLRLFWYVDTYPTSMLHKLFSLPIRIPAQPLKVKVKSLSCVQLFATPWTAAHQAPPSIGFSRQEYWSGLPLPSPTYHNSLSQKLFALWSHPKMKAKSQMTSMGHSSKQTDFHQWGENIW